MPPNTKPIKLPKAGTEATATASRIDITVWDKVDLLRKVGVVLYYRVKKTPTDIPLASGSLAKLARDCVLQAG
jgi:hypothetical protein